MLVKFLYEWIMLAILHHCHAPVEVDSSGSPPPESSRMKNVRQSFLVSSILRKLSLCKLMWRIGCIDAAMSFIRWKSELASVSLTVLYLNYVDLIPSGCMATGHAFSLSQFSFLPSPSLQAHSNNLNINM